MSAITQRLRDLRRGLSGRRQSRKASRAERQIRRGQAYAHYKDLKNGPDDGGPDRGGVGV